MSELPNDHNAQVHPDAVIAYQLSKLKRAKSEADNAGNDLRGIRSTLEAEGLNKKAATDALKIAKGGKENIRKMVEYIESLTRYLRVLGCPLEKAQLDLFEHGTALQPIDEQAYEEGLLAGRSGEDRFENPHDVNSDSGRKWDEGYDVGAEERKILDQIQPGEELIKGEGHENNGQSDVEAAIMAAE